MEIDMMTLAELEDLHARVSTRIEQVRAIEQVPDQVRVLVTGLLEATGREMGAPWVAPSGAHDAYPAGWEVTHEGKTWKSNHSANVWEPGTPESTNLGLWEDMSPPPEPDPETGIPEWAPGTDYLYGDNVMYEGVQYMVQLAHRSQTDWLPPNVPALYTRVG